MATDRLPADAVPPMLVGVLLAVVKLSEQGPVVTIADVCRETGYSSKGDVQRRLVALRDLGLVEWIPRKAGTLRPCVARVAATGV